MIGKRTHANYDFLQSIALNSKPPNLNAYIVLKNHDIKINLDNMWQFCAIESSKN
jgi:hypothetical protein